MRFAIAALMTLFLVGTIVAQDAPSAQDATQPTASSDATTPADQTPPPAEAPAAAPAAEAPATTTPPTTETPAAAAAPAPAAAQPKSSFVFAGGVNLGSDVLLTGPNGGPETWTRLGFQPDLSFGKIGVGFDLTIHFMLYPDRIRPSRSIRAIGFRTIWETARASSISTSPRSCTSATASRAPTPSSRSSAR
jgi:hypothetical protein